MSKLMTPSLAAMLLAAVGFAIWVVFSTLPALVAGGGIREAWDTNAYWMVGIPILLAAIAAAGVFSDAPPWALAFWAVIGHLLGAILVVRPGTSYGLLPLTFVFIGLPLFAGLSACAWLGRYCRRAFRLA